MKSLEYKINEALVSGKKYIQGVKANVEPKYHTIWNTNLFLVTWFKCLGRGSIAVSKDLVYKFNIAQFAFYYLKFLIK